jgi:hypothetical protein
MRRFRSDEPLEEECHACQIEKAAARRRRRIVGQAWRHAESTLKDAFLDMAESIPEMQLEEFVATESRRSPEHAWN